MLEIKMDGLTSDSIRENFSYEELPLGNQELIAKKGKDGNVIAKVIKATTTSGETYYKLNFLFGSTAKGFKGINVDVPFLGVISKTYKKGPKAGTTEQEDCRALFGSFLTAYGISKDEYLRSTLVVPGLEDSQALEDASYKGVPTDIIFNGQSLSNVLTSTAVKAEVVQNAKGKRVVYHNSISAAKSAK